MEEQQREINVAKSEETKTHLSFATHTHLFKIEEGALDNIEGQFAALQTKIQKGMKQTVDVSRPEWWEESWKAIFKSITGQELIDDFVNEEK